MVLFKQTRYLSTREVQFKQDGILYTTSNPLNSKEIFVPYEEIQFEKLLRELKTDKVNVWIAGIAGFISIKFLIRTIDFPNSFDYGLLYTSLLVFVFFIIAAILSRRHLLFISTFNSGLIELYDENPSRIEVEEFLTELKNETSKFLKDRYATIDRDLPIDNQLQNLSWLKNRKILTETEYEELKSKLTGNRNEIKGFGNSNQ